MQVENRMAMNGSPSDGAQEDDQNQVDDYYGNFARRVYFLAEQEGWDQKKVMHYFNDKPAFEKFYNNVSELVLPLKRDFMATDTQWSFMKNL